MTAEVPDLSFLRGAENAPAHREDLAVIHEMDYWGVNNSTIRDYSARARMPGGQDALLDIITRTIGYDPNNAGLEISAGTDMQALADLVNMGVLGKAVGTNYRDERYWRTRQNKSLTHIAGDIADPTLWKSIDWWQREQAPEGFALAMHRPIAALQELPQHTYLGAAHFILDRVREGGLLFTQIPETIEADKSALGGLCEAVRARSDVRQVILSEPVPVDAAPSWDYTYAVILKH